MFRSLREAFSSAMESKRARQLKRAKEQLQSAKTQLKRAKERLNFFAQQEFASIAARFLREGRRLTEHPDIDALIKDGLLQPHVFSQKSPKMMQFYSRLLRGLSADPKRIFEIGVKSGGSLMLWRALFPQATIVGMDLGLPKTRQEGIIYVTGDQSDPERLKEIGQEYGPFDLVIDDGSHVGLHQLVTLQTLLPYVSPGGMYVVEDVHVALKPDRNEYGPDVWADFVATIFTCLRRRPAEIKDATLPVQMAFDLAPRIQDVILAYHTLALRISDKAARQTPS